MSMCAMCQLEQENCVCAVRKAEAARRDSMRPIGMVTRDVRRQRAREYWERKRMAEAMAASMVDLDEIYAEAMLRALKRPEPAKRPSLIKRIADFLGS